MANKKKEGAKGEFGNQRSEEKSEISPNKRCKGKGKGREKGPLEMSHAEGDGNIPESRMWRADGPRKERA